MMNHLPEELLAERQRQGLLRTLPPSEKKGVVNFASNDYLGLSTHPAILESFAQGIYDYGAGSGASRLVCGNFAPHEALESTLASLKKSEAAVSFSNGYATSVGILSALLGKNDTLIVDKLIHASLIDGARLSGATLRVFPHNQVDKLEKLLKKISAKRAAHTRLLIATESVFSMDGDTAPLEAIVELSERYDALLLVDEAHGLGVLGDTGMGLIEALGLGSRIAFQMGTLGKAAGVAGGYIATSQKWRDYFINFSRSFIYSTAPPPACAQAATTALRIIASQEGKKLRNQLHANITELKNYLNIAPSPSPQTAIIPYPIGDNEKALHLAKKLYTQGYDVPAIRYPTVPPHTARLRITLSARHRSLDINNFCTSLKKEKKQQYEQ